MEKYSVFAICLPRLAFVRSKLFAGFRFIIVARGDGNRLTAAEFAIAKSLRTSH